ncbi:MAG: hypothetical protein M1839_005162 [Geoglossum umbratile]|nr:MAG: hypothetical protein M1839_005162 [Geoglossum umbratile]
MAAARALLDELHNPLQQNSRDHNTYILGRIGRHNVVFACLPNGVMGTLSAARVANQMHQTFERIRFGLIVGIGGGAPSEENDIRLGDIVISKPTARSGGVIQYDFGKTVREGRFKRTGSLNRPPDVLLTALSHLESKHMTEGPELMKYLSEMLERYPRLATRFARPDVQYDLLYDTEYDHILENATCSQCDPGRLIDREPRLLEEPIIHYGLIASGDQVMRDGATRERLRRELDVLCFEMEAAGLMDEFPCLVIRGICDYADSHKSKRWQGYAAAAAAAYAKELLSVIPGNLVISVQKLQPAQNTNTAVDQKKGMYDEPEQTDSKLAVSASLDKTVRLRDSTTGVVCCTLKGHSGSVWGVAFSPDGKLVASASSDKTVRLWDSTTGVVCCTLEGHSGSVLGVAFSPNGKLVASASGDKTVRLWDSATGAVCYTLKGHSDQVLGVAFSPDSKLVASASSDKTVRLWDSATGAVRYTLRGHSNLVTSVAFSPDSKLVASASSDKTIRLWDSATGAVRYTLKGHSNWVDCVAFSPNGKLIASASSDKTIRLWDSATGAAHYTLEGHSDDVYYVAISPGGKLIASASGYGTVVLSDFTTGIVHYTLEGHSGHILGVAFSPDVKLVASASLDKTVRLWSLATGEG